MSRDLEQLIGRAVVDKEFRDSVIADPNGATKNAGFQLDEGELDQIKQTAERIKADPDAQKQVDQQFAKDSAAFW